MPPALESWSLNHWSTREAPVIHFFLLTNNIPLYGYILFTHPSFHGHLGCFQLLAIMNDATMNFMYEFSCVQVILLRYTARSGNSGS